MRLVTAQELRFQDLPHISLPFIAQAEIKRYYNSENYLDKMSNVSKVLDSVNFTFPIEEQLTHLTTKVNDLELFLVSPSLSESITDTLVRLKENIEAEEKFRGLNPEHWQVHPQLIGLAKFNAELLIQRLTFFQRVYGVNSL